MTAYLDASVVLRKVLGQPGSLAEWESIDSFCASSLTRVECLRTLDRGRLTGEWPAQTLATYSSAATAVFLALDEIEVSPAVLGQASLPLPVPIGTLDAIHLSSALRWDEEHADEDFVLATHDQALGRAAQLMGLRVIGV